MAYTRGARVMPFRPGFIPFAVVFQVVLNIVRLYGWVIYRIRFIGRENLHGLRGAVLVSNHTLLFDPGIIAHAIRPRRTYFTMLEETALVPFLGTFVRLLGGVPIPERAGALRTLDTAARSALSDLGFIHFFPEGECYEGNQDIMPFHWGAFLLAARLGVPVVPITTVLHERRWRGLLTVRILGRAVRVPPRVTIVIGSPMAAPSLGALPGTPRPPTLKEAAAAWGSDVRATMQAVIDREGGSRSLFRGQMPRMGKRRQTAA
jgi:1-acyl-sn-glycerol-3-phosphate acyltransferase